MSQPNTLMIDDVEYVRADSLKEEGGHPYEIGKNYFIRTVTNYYTGRLDKVFGQELVITDVAWIADTGRFENALKTGDFSEVEPFPEGEVIIGRGAIVDAAKLTSSLPRSQK